MLVSSAHDPDTSAVSPVRARRASWGRNCGTARIAATRGSKLKTARTGISLLLGWVGSFATKVYCGEGRKVLRVSHIFGVMLKYSMRVDDIDREILAELQENGRLTVTELADRVRLTPAPCHRRLRDSGQRHAGSRGRRHRGRLRSRARRGTADPARGAAVRRPRLPDARRRDRPGRLRGAAGPEAGHLAGRPAHHLDDGDETHR